MLSSQKFQSWILLFTATALLSRADDADWKPNPAPLMTRWSAQVSPSNVLPEYPRPQMVRKDWQNLNGLWDLALTPNDATTPPTEFTEKILVPFPYESALSGIRKPSPTKERLWYRRTFSVPTTWSGGKILLHFGAVNWQCDVLVNGTAVGSHKGGYDGFDFDITNAIKPGDNELIVSAYNPLKHDAPDGQALGKQREGPGGVLYTASTGIWQTVWLEPVPTAHISSLRITPDVDDNKLKVNALADGADGLMVSVTVTDGGNPVATVQGPANADVEVPIPNAKLWSPEDPHLYDLSLTLSQAGRVVDAVTSYAAMRKIGLAKDDKGRMVITLNNQPYFEVGALDQGYWPDGIYTAPTDEARHYDIDMAKKLGFNLLRKHAKVEPDRWYYWTDKIGMLVWQDMPQLFGDGDTFTQDTKDQFLTEWTHIVPEFYNHPSIVVWTLFNENWGQHDTEAITDATRKMDASRLINSASGGIYYTRNGKRSDFREDLPPGVGDIIDQHVYPDPSGAKPDDTRAAVTGEYGGVTMAVDGHRWNTRVFGYGSTLRGSSLLTARYQQLLKEAWDTKVRLGSSAVVYTQITDVEDEINGMLTYDREIVKPDAAIILAANQDKFPDLPPNPNVVIVPTSETTPQTWKYTTDKPGDDWSSSQFDDSQWQTSPAPFGKDVKGVNTPWASGDIWLRSTFTLTDGFPKSLSVLIKDDDNAEVYLNGVMAADVRDTHGNEYFQQVIKPEAIDKLQSGPNVIAVHCHQTVGGQIIDVGVTEDDK